RTSRSTSSGRLSGSRDRATNATPVSLPGSQPVPLAWPKMIDFYNQFSGQNQLLIHAEQRQESSGDLISGGCRSELRISWLCPRGHRVATEILKDESARRSFHPSGDGRRLEPGSKEGEAEETLYCGL